MVGKIGLEVIFHNAPAVMTERFINPLAGDAGVGGGLGGMGCARGLGKDGTGGGIISKC